ncbi:MAG: Lpg1974 family pore-forming outer membrane protein, partial [Planctomycetota bacterium]
ETLGARVNYWEFDQDGNNRQFVSDGVILPGAIATTVIYPASIIAPAPGDILTTASSLNVRTIDAEGTVDVRLRETELTFGGGLRFASTDQHIFAAATRAGAPIGLLRWSRDYQGLGPTVSAGASHPLFGGLSAVGNFRGSLLFGEKDLNRTVVGDVTPAPVATTPVIALNNSDEVVAAGDMGIGLRYTMDVSSRAQMFVQGTYEGQIWTDAGQPTMTFLGFQGLGLALGFTY